MKDDIFAENKRLQAEVDKLVNENMELTAVIRSLRKNAREDAEKCRIGKCREEEK